MSTFLWIALPYLCVATFFVGHFLRYRYDQFGWTTRSSQIYESTRLRIASPLFHFGLLGVFGGHFLGLVIPKWLTESLGISQEAYHAAAVGGGWTMGIVATVGLVLLLWRRFSIKAVLRATTRMDVVAFTLLTAVFVFGIWNTLFTTFSHSYDYRDGVSVYFRQLFYFQPEAQLMATAPISFQLHLIAVFALVAVWPFTRLVHVLSAPLGYAVRPYIVYRSRGGISLGSRHLPEVRKRPALK